MGSNPISHTLLQRGAAYAGFRRQHTSQTFVRSARNHQGWIRKSIHALFATNNIEASGRWRRLLSPVGLTGFFEWLIRVVARAAVLMGRKERREREQKRQSYASKHSAEKRKQLLIAIGILGVIAGIVAYASWIFISLPAVPPDAPPNAGALGSAHAHAAILVEVFGDRPDFTSPAYQFKSNWIHFEGGDGSTIHKHATGVTLEFFFESLGITVNEECFVLPNGRDYCTDSEYQLRFFINGEEVSDIHTHEIEEDDRILISYGATPDELRSQLLRLDNQILIKR